jgi:hypothetical protein
MGTSIASNNSDDGNNAGNNASTRAVRPMLPVRKILDDKINHSNQLIQKRLEITAAIKEKQAEMQQKRQNITAAIKSRLSDRDLNISRLNVIIAQRQLEIKRNIKQKQIERDELKKLNIAQRESKREELKQKINLRKEEKKIAKGNELEARYSHLVCKINLGIAQSENLADYTSAETLTDLNDKIISDLEILNGYVELGDVTAFNTYERTTFNPDVKSLQDLIKSLTQNIKALNLSDEEKKSIRDSWKESVSAYSECNSESKKEIVFARSNFIDEQINEWNDAIKAAILAGVDATEMESIVNEAEELSNLLDQAANATTDDQMKSNIEEIRDLHLHLWARFNIAKVDAYLTLVEQQANDSGMQNDVAEIRQLLDEASAKAQPGKVYGDGDFQATWQNIKDASNKLRQLVNSIKEKNKA